MIKTDANPIGWSKNVLAQTGANGVESAAAGSLVE